MQFNSINWLAACRRGYRALGSISPSLKSGNVVSATEFQLIMRTFTHLQFVLRFVLSWNCYCISRALQISAPTNCNTQPTIKLFIVSFMSQCRSHHVAEATSYWIECTRNSDLGTERRFIHIILHGSTGPSNPRYKSWTVWSNFNHCPRQFWLRSSIRPLLCSPYFGKYFQS